MQVDPSNPKLKLPGSKLLKPKCGYTGFNFCFQIQLTPLHPGGDGVRGHHGGARRIPIPGSYHSLNSVSEGHVLFISSRSRAY